MQCFVNRIYFIYTFYVYVIINHSHALYVFCKLGFDLWITVFKAACICIIPDVKSILKNFQEFLILFSFI